MKGKAYMRAGAAATILGLVAVTTIAVSNGLAGETTPSQCIKGTVTGSSEVNLEHAMSIAAMRAIRRNRSCRGDVFDINIQIVLSNPNVKEYRVTATPG